jgi:hypothetical protein
MWKDGEDVPRQAVPVAPGDPAAAGARQVLPGSLQAGVDFQGAVEAGCCLVELPEGGMAQALPARRAEVQGD